jgi:predicted phage-related endonuclease
MITHQLTQGSPEWLAYRAQHFNASDAPAMMGCSPYKTRAELLRELHTGVAAEVDVATQKRFDNGHRAEALARPLAEKIIGDELYPVTGSLGRLSASFDGLTLDESEGFEHKALNADIRAAFAVIDKLVGGDDTYPGQQLPLYHRVQMEQQLHISGASRILFMATEWTAEGELVDERSCWYYPDEVLRGEILAGWAQFERDLAAYVLPEAAAPAPVGKAPDMLPALRIEVTGAVTASNLAEFKATALGAIRSVNRNLATDQDFADAEKAVKWCADVESRLKAAKEHALSQTTSIEALFRAIDEISGEARTVRLDLDKLVTRRKGEVKEEAVAKARRALDQHIAQLNAEIAPTRVPVPVADFAGCIKGLKSVASMQDKLDGLLATAKIAAEADARAIRANVATFHSEAAGFEFLFADLGQVVHKAADDFKALVVSRIATHKAAEAAKEAKRKADEEARIAAAAEQARREEEARQQALRRQQAEEAARLAAPAVAAAAAPAPTPAPAPVVAAPALAAVKESLTAEPTPADTLRALAAEARASRFPTNPKMGPEWWARWFAAVDALEVA